MRLAGRVVNAAPMIDLARRRQNVEADADLLTLLQREGLSGRGFEAADSGVYEATEPEARAHYPLAAAPIPDATEAEWIA